MKRTAKRRESRVVQGVKIKRQMIDNRNNLTNVEGKKINKLLQIKQQQFLNKWMIKKNVKK